MTSRRLAVLVLALAGAVACGRPAGDGGGAASVLLVSIDTLRADRLALYGYGKGSTPSFDRLGREGVVFDDAYSHCPLTLPAHASLFTGLLPPEHGVRDNLGFTLRTPRTLAARFKASGFKTGGAISAFVLRKETGIALGFDSWDDQVPVGDSPLTAARDGAMAAAALGQWIETQGQDRFFAFLHLYEPHAPYAPPERYRGSDPYDGEVSYADEILGRLLERLRSRGLLDRMVVAVTADHGEGLLDHGEQEHGVFLYRETVRIPLVFRLPRGARAGARVRGPVAQVDIPATLLDLAGLPADGMTGVSLRNALDTGRSPDRPVYSETFYPRFHFGWSELVAASEARYRYVRAPHSELYDLAADPGERQNRIAEKRDVASAMDSWLDARTGTGPAPVPAEVAPEARERLEALGYVGLGAGRAQEKINALASAARGSLPDPKDKIVVYELLRQALVAKGAGRLAEAAAELQKIVATSARLPEAWAALGETLLQLNRSREGTLALRRALELDPDRLTTVMSLAASLAATDQTTEALALYRRAEALRHTRGLGPLPGLHSGAGDCLARLGRLAEAEREMKAEVAAFPGSVEARVQLAALYRALDRRQEARAVLLGLGAASPDADACAAVLGALQDLDDASAAAEWARRAHSAFPADPRFR
jgi:arylsulfatase A-like enzyme/Tfp pilus assembly protein PilF